MTGTTWQVGIDLGTTYTAAAVHREGRVEVVWLGERTAVIPSVVFVKDDGTVLTGEAANRQGLAEPERAAREFKRRVGDPTPLIVGRQPFSADLLTAHLLRDVVQRVVEREGSQPGAVCLTHPANWGPYKLDLLKQAVDQAGLGDRQVTYVAEPQAAAIHYATQERVEPGAVVAVYDLGGGTFDAALVRKGAEGFEIIGRPQGVERLGGIDFDIAVLSHVDSALDGAISRLSPDDEEIAAALARLRAECTDAKEVLSSDTETTITVSLPDLRHSVRLTRTELEGMIRGPISESVEALRRALDSANVAPEQLHAVLLAGGSSRIPFIGQVVSAELGRPVAVDAHPKHAVAMGAALAAAQASGGGGEAVTVVSIDEDENPGRLATGPAPERSHAGMPVAPVAAAGVAGAGIAAAAVAVGTAGAGETSDAGDGANVANATPMGSSPPPGMGPSGSQPGPGAAPGQGAPPSLGTPPDLTSPPAGAVGGADGGLNGGAAPPADGARGKPVWLVPVAALAIVVILGVAFLATRLGGGGSDDPDTIVAGGDPGSEASDEGPGTDFGRSVSPESGPQTFTVDKTVWWGGFEVTVGEVTFTPGSSAWDVEVELALENLYPGNNTLTGDTSLTLGGRSTAGGFYTDTPEVPGGGRNQATLTFSVVDDSGSGDSPPELNIDDVVLTFGASDQNQAVVPLGAGEVDTFVLTSFSVDKTLVATGDEVEFTFKDGFVDASYGDGDEGLYHVWVTLDMEYLGDSRGGFYVDSGTLSLEAPSGESVAAGYSVTTGVDDSGSAAIYPGRPGRNLTLGFKIPSPGTGTYTITYDQKNEGSLTGEVTFDLEDIDFP